MTTRRGEKIGWLGGWGGAYCWLPVLAVLMFLHERPAAGLVFLVVPLIGMALVVAASPWRNPRTPYWKLMLSASSVLGVGMVAAVALAGGPGELGLRWWNLVWLLPAATPVFVAGRRTWQDGAPQR